MIIRLPHDVLWHLFGFDKDCEDLRSKGVEEAELRLAASFDCYMRQNDWKPYHSDGSPLPIWEYRGEAVPLLALLNVHECVGARVSCKTPSGDYLPKGRERAYD